MGGGAVEAVWCDPLTTAPHHTIPAPTARTITNRRAKAPTLGPNTLHPNTLPIAPKTTAAYTTTLYTATPYTTAQHTIYPPPKTPHTPA